MSLSEVHSYIVFTICFYQTQNLSISFCISVNLLGKLRLLRSYYQYDSVSKKLFLWRMENGGFMPLCLE